MFTKSHDYLIEDTHLESVQTAKAQGKFKPIWEQSKRILAIILYLPLPKHWKEVLEALLIAGDAVEDKADEIKEIADLPPVV